jgi:hypothetical protein
MCQFKIYHEDSHGWLDPVTLSQVLSHGIEIADRGGGAMQTQGVTIFGILAIA